MRFLVWVAPVLATEIDQESLLQISSVNRHSISNLQDQLESRANKNSQTSKDFDAAMETKPHQEGSCDAEAFEELTECLTIGGMHLSDVLAGQLTLEEITASLGDADCDTLVRDMACIRRSECFQVPVNKFDVVVQVPNPDGNSASDVSPASFCATAEEDTLVGQACQMTPHSMCQLYESYIDQNLTCAHEGCEPMGEVNGLETGVCDQNAGSDFYIRTEQGCKDAVQQYADANMETLQAEMDQEHGNGQGKKRRKRGTTVNIRYHKKLAKWRKKNTASQPMGCYLHFGGKGNNIRGYFNPWSALTDEENRKKDKVGSGKKKIETLCKRFDSSNGQGNANTRVWQGLGDGMGVNAALGHGGLTAGTGAETD